MDCGFDSSILHTPKSKVINDPLLELARLLDKINQREKLVDIPRGEEEAQQ